MDFNRAKTEHKRWQEEQRQLKREQQQEADGIRRQQRRDSQRWCWELTAFCAKWWKVVNICSLLLCFSPCTSPVVLVMDFAEGSQWFLNGSKIGAWGVREWVHSIISKGKFPSILLSDQKCWHQAPAHLGVLLPLFGHRFNPHNLTKSSGILTEHGLPEYLLCVLCTVFLFLLLFLYEKFEKFCFGNRQRLRQRTLQGLEKQLEHKERALQHMALLQAAGAERSRKESFFQEEEERKARQRLQFLKTKRLQREELQAQSNERSCEQEKERLVRAIPEVIFLFCHVSSIVTIWSICLPPILHPV